jgi:hypothetical protein
MKPSSAIALARVRLAIVEERLRLLGDHDPGLAGGRVNLDDAVDLVPALVVLERQRAAVLAPLQSRHVVRVRKQRVVDVKRLLRVEVKQHGLLEIQHVAGLRVEPRRVLGLEL